MVKQGQPSPVVSLPFRLYWQLSDPAVWITIISHSPHCVPPVSQTYSQTKTPTCVLRKTRPQKYPHAPKKQTRLARNRNSSHELSTSAELCQTRFITTALHFHHFVPNLTECLLGEQLMSDVKRTLRRGMPSH